MSLDWPIVLAVVIAAVGWGGLVALAHWLAGVKIRSNDDPAVPALYRLIQLYVRLVHRLRVEGAEHIPRRDASTHPEGGDWLAPNTPPLIVVANHTAGIDPLLIVAVARFDIRWMMASDMRVRELEWLWQYARIIFVDREKPDARSLKAALGHLKLGGTLGIFPEGHIERPPEHLLPFKPGLGVLARRSGALVLPVLVTGTPQIDPAWASLWKPSRSVVRFLQPVRYDTAWEPEAIRNDIEQRFRDVTGWPAATRQPTVLDGNLYVVRLDGTWCNTLRPNDNLDEDTIARLEAMQEHEPQPEQARA